MKEVTIGSWSNQMNVGYIRQLKLIATSDILRFDEPFSFDNLLHQFSYEGLELKEDATVYSIDFYRRECSFSESSAIDVSGIIYDFNIDWTWICQHGELLDFLHKNRYKQWITFFTDQNGKSYVVGSLELPMTLLFGRSIQQSNFIKIRLNAKSWHPAWFIENINLLEAMAKVIDLTRYTLLNIKVMRGDTLNETFIFSNEDGTPQILTDDQFLMQVRDYMGAVHLTLERRIQVPGNVPEGDSSGPFWVENGFSLNAENNALIMNRASTEMTINAGVYKYDLVRISSNGFREVQMKGQFIVEENITSIITNNYV